MRILFLILSLFSAGVTAATPATQLKIRPVSQANSVLAIYTQDWGLFSVGGSKLIFAAWPDGHVVWSGDSIQGGVPFFAAEIPPAKVVSLITRLEKDGIFSDSKLGQSRFGPESKFTTVLLRSGKKQLMMSSWHELSEADGTSVATAGGIVALGGRRRLAVLAKEPAGVSTIPLCLERDFDLLLPL